MNQVTYTNRYKDIITFTHEGDTVTMQGGRWLRWSYDDTGILMVDPSGGPYIELENNLAHFWPKGEYKDLIIESITVGDHDENDGTVVTFKIR